MLIDAHMHIFPAVAGYNRNGFTKSAGGGFVKYAGGETVRLLPPSFRETASLPETLIDYMDWQGVDHAVVLQGPLYGEINDYLLEAAKRWPGRFTVAAMLDPYLTGARQALRHIVEDQRFKVLKLECSEQFGLSGIHPGLDYRDGAFERVWEAADKNGLTVVIDTGLPGSDGYKIEALKQVALKHPGLRMVVAHLGFPPAPPEREKYEPEWRRCLELGKVKNIWFDISSLVGLGGEEYPFPLAQEYIRIGYETVGADKLIFGTDFPGILTKCTYEQAILYVRNHCAFLPHSDKAKILSENAVKVYQIDSGRRP